MQISMFIPNDADISVKQLPATEFYPDTGYVRLEVDRCATISLHAATQGLRGGHDTGGLRRLAAALHQAADHLDSLTTTTTTTTMKETN